MEVYRGDTDKITVAVVDDTDTPISIVGMTLRFKVLNKERATVIEKVITVHDNAAGGLTSIPLTSTDTDLTPGVYNAYYRLESNTGDLKTFSEEQLTIMASGKND